MRERNIERPPIDAFWKQVQFRERDSGLDWRAGGVRSMPLAEVDFLKACLLNPVRPSRTRPLNAGERWRGPRIGERSGKTTRAIKQEEPRGAALLKAGRLTTDRFSAG